MTAFIHRIQERDLTKLDETQFKHRYVGCLILTNDQKILLQQRGVDWNHFPGYLSEFGGRIESNESPMQALIRELKEELGAQVKAADVTTLGTITEESTEHSELVYVYFWHDKDGTITGCYEGKAVYFDKIKDVLACPNIMDSVRWLLNQCRHQQFIK
jgi:8-oxo-dGTP diphosphatase